MSVTIYVPRDSGALALGADKVAKAIEAEIDSRGARCQDRAQRLARRLFPGADGRGGDRCGPRRLRPGNGQGCAVVVRCRLRRPAGRMPLSLGDPEKIPFFAKQTRLTFARCGITDPVSLDDYQAHDGLKGLQNAVAMTPADIVKAGHGVRACADAAAPASRPASSGRRCSIRQPIANTSSAMPTRATAAPSPTA